MTDQPFDNEPALAAERRAEGYDPNAAPPNAATADALAELDDLLATHDEPDDEIAAIIPDIREMFTIPSGKYKGLTLPRMIGVKPSYYDKVNALREEIEADPEFQRQAGTIGETYAALRREAEVVTSQLSDIKLRLTAVMLIMLDQYEVECVTGMTMRNGDKVRWNPEPHLIVTDKEVFRQWCLQNELERDMVLPWGKANKLVKDMLIDGRGEPPGAECYMRPKVNFTKGEK